MKRISLDETVSTNRYAKELPEDERHELTLVTAEYQRRVVGLVPISGSQSAARTFFSAS